MLRKTAFAALAAAALFTAVPAYAGPAETAYLQKLTNSWSGKGTLRGADTGTITCRVDLKAGSQNVKYQGRCTIPDMAGQAFNGSIVMLLGSFVIGAISGGRGMTMLKPFIVDPYAGFLCLFLLDMGLVAGRGLAKGRRYITPALGVFAIAMPLVGACCAAALAWAIGLSAGGAAVLITLAASASYIAAPAAMRLALPEANPGIALTLSLALTFPFNLLVGIPLYIAAARHIAS